VKLVKLTQRSARLLRDNLTSNQEGYDFLDLLRLERLAKQLTDLQGDYAVQMAELGREEKQIRRQAAREQISEAEANKALQNISFEADDLHEAANGVAVDFEIEDSDHRLVLSKLDAVNRWLGNDELRPIIIGMMEAVKAAGGTEQGETKPKQLRRRA
jgi:hypothetical protein